MQFARHRRYVELRQRAIGAADSGRPHPEWLGAEAEVDGYTIISPILTPSITASVRVPACSLPITDAT